MSATVRIPTILRTYTGGAKTVQADGSTLSALIDDLDTKHTGLKGRLITDDGGLRGERRSPARHHLPAASSTSTSERSPSSS